ncbi:hypothetical protein SCLCIDRAFT_1217409 [Scleroderma citrinum Foug A]|uniref:Uncharacterized protein n=1 Tax=Scleroderma citrinum Foug A TaxID=1036808 RepID=A0A0C3DGF9_9AGAM|nr:hypothetical protein SCLCIDRAFT_1217409 [Scleroderma citrinum Foug A]
MATVGSRRDCCLPESGLRAHDHARCTRLRVCSIKACIDSIDQWDLEVHNARTEGMQTCKSRRRSCQNLWIRVVRTNSRSAMQRPVCTNSLNAITQWIQGQATFLDWKRPSSAHVGGSIEAT